MSTLNRLSSFTWLASLVLAGAAVQGRATAQTAGQDPREEIKELFKRVEKELQEIDKLLLEAAREPRGTSEGSSTPRATAKTALDKQNDVSQSIQKILDLIPTPPGGGS